MPTPSPKLGLALPSQPDDFSTADVRANWEKIDAAPGLFICTSTTRPIWGPNQVGRHIYETNTGVTRAWTGTTWTVYGFEPGDTKWSARVDASEGWLPCDGRILNRSTYSHLFAAIGTAHNTADQPPVPADSFRIPNIVGRVLVGRNPAGNGTYGTIGSRQGADTNYLQQQHLPLHTHTMNHTHPINHGHTAASSQIDTNHSHDFTVGGGGHEHNYSAAWSRGVSGQASGATVSDYSFYVATTSGGGGHTHSGRTGGIADNTGRWHTPTITVDQHSGSSGQSSAPVTGAGPGLSADFSIHQSSVTLNCFIKI